MKAAVGKMRDDLRMTERQLAAERQAAEDAVRRGKLAGDIGDKETVDVADRFATRHLERANMLEQKLAAQRNELALAERELEDMTAELKTREGPGSTDAAWRSMENAGGSRPETDLAGDGLRGTMDRAAHEAAAEAQLRELKKKMGK
jgi:hypothetical protein